MALLLETTCSLGKLVMEQDPPPSNSIRVHIHRWGYDKHFSKDKVTSASAGYGRGSLIGTKFVQINLIGGETVILKNVLPGPADYLARILS